MKFYFQVVEFTGGGVCRNTGGIINNGIWRHLESPAVQLGALVLQWFSNSNEAEKNRTSSPGVHRAAGGAGGAGDALLKVRSFSCTEHCLLCTFTGTHPEMIRLFKGADINRHANSVCALLSSSVDHVLLHS